MRIRYGLGMKKSSLRRDSVIVSNKSHPVEVRITRNGQVKIPGYRPPFPGEMAVSFAAEIARLGTIAVYEQQLRQPEPVRRVSLRSLRKVS
jgi:hypothetical protein